VFMVLSRREDKDGIFAAAEFTCVKTVCAECQGLYEWKGSNVEKGEAASLVFRLLRVFRVHAILWAL